MITITNAIIRVLTNGTGKTRAIASIVINDCFAVHDIKILEGDKGLFIAMPSRRIPSGEFKDVAHPINAEVRALIEEKVFEAYNKALETDQQD